MEFWFRLEPWSGSRRSNFEFRGWKDATPRKTLLCERGKKSFEKKEKKTRTILLIYIYEFESRIEKHGHTRSNEKVRLDFAYREREDEREREKKKECGWAKNRCRDVKYRRSVCVCFWKDARWKQTIGKKLPVMAHFFKIRHGTLFQDKAQNSPGVL